LEIRHLESEWIAGTVALQRACFPPPFPEELLWKPEHLERHLAVFPEGQFVAIADGLVVGSASSLIISEARYQAHPDWATTVGGHFLTAHDPHGSTLYGVDISVHPSFRGRGVGRALYQARKDLVRQLSLVRFATACRLPGFADSGFAEVEPYVEAVVSGELVDRTLSPLLRYGMICIGVVHDYMDDEESGNAAAMLEWTP
jgi:GNAT superfamily N-acetyltransferase